MGEVGCVHECPPGQHLQVVIPQVEFHSNLEEAMSIGHTITCQDGNQSEAGLFR